ncbi:hypothetical protein GH714_038161 [Hevea brasiliensis]|uniref:RING-type E3 ubiquitin transferase n=1 Tax=Hevea brasiliensis TaxID=3981 RepID=A0A6A6LQ03_HEVBR|nr:hypothetical protein GH714_038161 [Hevea brasiliensis]
MSSSGDTTADAAVAKPYFCYQCNCTVTITVSASSDPYCPLCHEGFLEEYENPSHDFNSQNPNPNQNPNPLSDPNFSFLDPVSTLLPLLFSSSTTIDLQNPNLFGNSRAASLDPDAFNPMDFLRNHLQNLHSGGARIQFVIDNHPSDPGLRLPTNIGDYFIGPGLEQLIQQLAENDPNRYGTPPASESAIFALPTIKITEELLNSEMNQCAVCKDEFEKGAEAKQMPCKHVYHNDCILPWLKMHNSCPVCRYELPTDNDADYESRTHGSRRSQGSNGAGSGGDNRTVERRFSVSLPWPFGRHGSSSDGGAGGQSSA